MSKLQTEFSFEFSLLKKLREAKFIGKSQDIITVKSFGKRLNPFEYVYEMLVNKFFCRSGMRTK
jgi:hypothetical protein